MYVMTNEKPNFFVQRGVGAMEIVAMDMKVSGMYIARQLSFSGVSFRIEEIALDKEFKVVYNKAARLVRGCTLSLSEHSYAAERKHLHVMTRFFLVHQSCNHSFGPFQTLLICVYLYIDALIK